jgi:hypothetical protein
MNSAVESEINGKVRDDADRFSVQCGRLEAPLSHGIASVLFAHYGQ